MRIAINAFSASSPESVIHAGAPGALPPGVLFFSPPPPLQSAPTATEIYMGHCEYLESFRNEKAGRRSHSIDLGGQG